jgi:hypothetical protein
MNFFVCSDSDISLTISYRFNETTEPLSKKRKSNDSRRISILEYSTIKLPARIFIDYLANDLASFLEECQR